MLEKLTKEQEKIMYQHKAWYIDNIVNNYKYPEGQKLLKSEDIRQDVDWLYKKTGVDTPKYVFIASSYLEEKIIINMIFNGAIELIKEETGIDDEETLNEMLKDLAQDIKIKKDDSR